MRAPTILIAAATLASAILTTAGAFSPAEARMSLAQCRSNELACKRNCLLGLNGQPATQDTVYGLTQCLNHCWDNHSACVDFVFNQMATLSTGTPPKKPPKASIFDPGLLSTTHDFAPQPPAGAGTPVHTAPVTTSPTGGSIIR
jgi:hypothetical protein